MNQSWSVIIFGFNEGESIAKVFESASGFLLKNNIPESEIIIVDDGSTDNTEQIICELKKSNNNINYIRNKKNMGIGPTLISGYKSAKYENLIAVPADGQFDIDELIPFINFPENHFVSFYRKNLSEYSLYRKVVTSLNKSFNKYILKLNIKDINWVKAYKSNELREIELELESSLVASEIMAKLCIKGCIPLESVSVYHQRKSGISRGASLKTLSKAGGELLKLSLIVRKYNKSQIKN